MNNASERYEVVGTRVSSYRNRQGKQVDGLVLYLHWNDSKAQGQAVERVWISGVPDDVPQVGDIIGILYDRFAKPVSWFLWD